LQLLTGSVEWELPNLLADSVGRGEIEGGS
jgi:hypothetical protein